MSDSVPELTAAIASGDTQAFARFYRRWFDDLFELARHASRRDESFCLDVVQDAMLRVIRSIKPMADEPRLRAWLRAVVRSCVCDRLRAEAARRRHEAAAGGPSPPAAEGDLEERLAWLRRALSELEGDQQQMLLMRHRFGWTLNRIGAAFGLAPAAVDGRLGRLLTRLRRKAAEAFHE